MSLALQIRDGAYTRILAAFPEFKKEGRARRTPLKPIQVEQTPALGVFLVRETMNPDGDAAVGPPRFVSDVIIGISVVANAAKPEVADGWLDGLVDSIEDTLFRDPTFVGLLDIVSGKPIIEGFSQVVRSYEYPKDGEAYFIEVRLQITCRYRCYFDPNAPNALTEVAVTAQPFGAGTSSQPAPTITAEYELPGS